MILSELQIKHIIEEERSISREVVQLVNEIEKKIQSINAKPFYTYTFKIKGILINYMMTSFKTLEEGYEWHLKNNRNDGYSFDEKKLYLTLTFINGVCDYNDLKNTIQHEVEHYWQTKNANKDFSNNRYSTIVRECFYSENPIVKYICTLLYYSYNFEIDANINGAFNVACKSIQKLTDYKTYIENTGLKNIYITLKNSHKNLEKYSMENLYFLSSINYLKSLNVFPKKYQPKEIVNFLKKKTKKSFHYLIKQIGKSFSLYLEKINLIEEQINFGKQINHLNHTKI